QIETQLHRLATERGHPVRRCRRQIERHNVAVAERPLRYRLRPQLLFAIAQTDQRTFAVFVDFHGFEGDVRFVECTRYAIDSRLLDQCRTALTGNLDGRVGRIQIGGGIKEADREEEYDQQILPQWILVHSRVPV